MRWIALALGACALLAAALWLLEPPGSPSPHPQVSGPAAAPAQEAGPAGPVATPPRQPEADRAAAEAPPAPAARAEGLEPAPERGPVPLERLLTLTEPLATPDPLVRGRIPADADAPEEGRLRFLHRRETAELGSERVAEDELGVLLTLDETRSLGLRGGVRVEREHSARSAEERQAGPAIGIEKRF